MDCGESPVWSRWPDACSQNCPPVLASMIPALSLKACQKAGSQLALTSNLRTVVQGCGYKGYPWRWWWAPFRNSLKGCRLITHVPLYFGQTMVQPRSTIGRAGKGATQKFCSFRIVGYELRRNPVSHTTLWLVI